MIPTLLLLRLYRGFFKMRDRTHPVPPAPGIDYWMQFL